MRALRRTLAFVVAFTGLSLGFASALNEPPPPQYAPLELINAGHQFFGTVSRELANVMEKAVSFWGQPIGYVLGQEGGGAFVAGCATARARSTPRMPATCVCSGRARASVGILAAKARAR